MVGILAIALGLLLQGLNIAVLVILAIGAAASTTFPIITLSLLWRPFDPSGVIGGVAVGLLSSVGLALLGAGFTGNAALLPFVNPTIVSTPLRFAEAVVGTLLGDVTERSRRGLMKSPSRLRSAHAEEL